MSRKYVTRSSVDAARDLKYEDVHVPEWKDETGAEWARVRGLTGKGRSIYLAGLVNMDSDGERSLNLELSDLRIAALCLVDENDVPLYSVDEIEALGAKDANPVNRIVAAAQRLSAITSADVGKAAENLDDTPSAASIST